jgi:hypothetical protein
VENFLEKEKSYIKGFSFKNWIKKEESKQTNFVLSRTAFEASEFFKDKNITEEKYYFCTKQIQACEIESEIEFCNFKRIILIDDYELHKKRNNLFDSELFSVALKKFSGNQNNIEMFFV